MDKKTKIVEIVKVATVIVAGVAVMGVVTAAVKNVLPMNEITKQKKLMFGIGTFVISSMVGAAGANYAGEIAGDYTNVILTNMDAIIKEFKKPIKEEKEEPLTEITEK